jgi:hypothetical protein
VRFIHNFITSYHTHSIRTMAATRNINLDVWTGTFGRFNLKDDNGNPHDIYLLANGATRQIPGPMIYYKILVNQATNQGIVLIGKLYLKYFENFNQIYFFKVLTIFT